MYILINMSDDSINTLVGAFSYVTADISTYSMEQCICIDTSANRIGINTLAPTYAIDISNFNANNPQYIRTPRLIISDISSLQFVGHIQSSYLLASGEVYVDASNYLRLRP